MIRKVKTGTEALYVAALLKNGLGHADVLRQQVQKEEPGPRGAHEIALRRAVKWAKQILERKDPLGRIPKRVQEHLRVKVAPPKPTPARKKAGAEITRSPEVPSYKPRYAEPGAKGKPGFLARTAERVRKAVTRSKSQTRGG